MNRTNKFLIAAYMLVGLTHVWGALYPAHVNWGVHLFAFYNPLISIIVLAGSILFLIPRIQKVVIVKLGALAQSLAQRSVWLSFVLASCALFLLSWLLPARLHLLGDGALLLRVVEGLNLVDETPPAFNHQPIVAFVFRLIQKIAQSGRSIKPETIFQGIDIIAGIAFVWLIFKFLRRLNLPAVDSTLLGLFLFLVTASQFFLGYVELYVLLYVFTFAYLVSGWLTLQHKTSVIIPTLCFVTMVGLHFVSLIFLPSLLIIYHGVFNKRRLEIISLVTLGVLALLIGYFLGYIRPDTIITRLLTESRYNFLPLFQKEEYFPNPVFSLVHFVDWANTNALIAPFGLLLAIILSFVNRKSIKWKEPLLIFLLIATMCGTLMTITLNPALGMARDWDFLASFFLPMMVLDVYLLRSYLRSDQNKQVFFAIVVLSGFHWAAWIGINASEDRHLQRFKMLSDNRFLAQIAQLNYDETLAAFYYAKNDYYQSHIYFEHYLKIDSSNTRILANVSDVYKKLGDEDKQFEFLQRAALCNSPNPSVYINLGVLYAHRGDTVSAITWNQHALQLDSTYAKAHANLGVLYMFKKEYALAAEHYSKAITYGLNEPFLYRDAAGAYFFFGEYEKSLHYYDAYISLSPADTKTRDVRDQLLEWLSKRHQ